jgi:Fic family protein
MTWNWQKPDWPHFSWDRTALAKAEEQFLLETGVFAGAFRHLGHDYREQLTVEAMSTEAVTTSKIEGEILHRPSVQSSIRKQLGLAPDKRRVGPAEEGIAEMMVDLFRRFAEPLSEEGLRAWRRMLVRGRRDLRDVGRSRTNKEPMQIVSGAIHAPRIHFEAPPSAALPKAMKDFVDWFNHTAPDVRKPLPSLTRAGIAHLYFVTIHPFEDGNGRVGRAIAGKSLAQGRAEPTPVALAATILAKCKAYYRALEATNENNEITPWLCWFAATAVETQHRTIVRVEFLIDKIHLLDRLRGQLNRRQEKALLRMLRVGPEGFRGGMSAGKYAVITGASPATATRDLADMVEKGAFTRAGEYRHARYHTAIPLRF